MGDMKICPRCASFAPGRTCDYCKIERVETDAVFDDIWQLPDEEYKKIIDHYIETLIADTYDSAIRKNREQHDKIVFARMKEHEKKIWNTPKCPTCGSTDVEKISIGKKIVGGAFLGLFSTNVRKQMHCKNCGYKW